MAVLIVESNLQRAERWRACIAGLGLDVHAVQGQAEAVRVMQTHKVRLIVLNLDLDEGSALAVADFASYRHPEAKVIFLTGSGMFSDGSIFGHAANACAFLPASTAPQDLAAMVAHYRTAA